MKTNIAHASSGNQRIESNQPLPAPLRDTDAGDAVRLFDRAVVDFMHDAELKAEDVAGELGCSYQHLSNYRNGSRTLAFHRVLKLAYASKVAALAFARVFAALAGYKLTPVRKATKQELRAQLALDIERNPAMLKLLLPESAQQLGIDALEAAAILDEPSGHYTVEELQSRRLR